MSWGKWRKSFFVAGVAHCRLEGWKRWFRCTGAGIRESDAFASQLHWDLQFQSGVLEVLHRTVTLGFAMQIVCSEVRFCEKSRVKRSFWKLGLSLLVKVSWKTLVLEAWIVSFCECLVENARFGSLDCHFWWKSRGKRSFWKLGLSVFANVSWKMPFWKLGFSLVQNARFLVLEASLVVSSKSVKQECPDKSVKQGCQARVARKSVKQDCQARVSSKSV